MQSFLAPEVFEAPSSAPAPWFERARLVGRLASGERNPNALTDALFFARHPELPRRALAAGQEPLMREWRAILREVVQPALSQLAARPASSSAAAALGPGTRVLLVGDSHTEGSFGRELEALLKGTGASVLRSAKSGSAIKYWLPRLPALLQQHAPEVVIVALGENMRGYPSARGTSAQVAQLVQLIRKERPGARLLWIGPPRRAVDSDAALARYNQVLRAGLDGAARFIDSAVLTPRYEGNSGGIHYNEHGGRLWARGAFAAVSASLSGAASAAPASAPARPAPARPAPARPAPARPVPVPASAGSAAAGGAPARVADVALGTLRHLDAAGKELSYQFTSADLEWTARYLMGEAGSDLERSAVLWAMLNRFAFHRRWKTFAGLLRGYSTPLQYPLNSVGAAYRHWKRCPGSDCKFVDLSADFGFYTPDFKGHKVPKGQLRQFIDLQRTPWARLAAPARRVAAAVLSGQVQNVAGLATEFDDSAVYWRDANPGKKGPTRQQWLEFTRKHAASKHLLWPSDTQPYDQYERNVLFVEERYQHETPPRVVPVGGASSELESFESDELETPRRSNVRGLRADVGGSSLAQPVLALRTLQIGSGAPTRLRQTGDGTFEGWFTSPVHQANEPPSQRRVLLTGRLRMQASGELRDYDGKSDGSAWPLRRARVNAVARTTRANGPSSSSGEEARLGPGGTFSTATQIGFDGAPARFSMVVRLELSRSKTVEASIELKLAELDIARFLATVDPRESARPASQTHAQFLSSVRKLYQGGAGDPLGSLFDWVLDKNARVKALFAPTTAEWKWLSSHPVLYADGEVADIGHVLTGIEGVLEQARIDERDLPRPIRPDLIVTWAGDLGSVFQYHMPEIVDAVAQGRAPDFAGYLQRRASRSDLIGDIDGINIGSSYDPSQTLAANLNAYYGKRSLGRFHEFIRSSLDDSGRPAIPLLAGSGLPKISAQGRRWIAFSVRRYLVYFYVLGRLSKGVPASQEKLVDQIVAEGSPQLAAVAEYFARFLEEGLQREL